MLRRQLGSAGKISQTSVPQTTIHAFMHAPPSTFMVTSQMQVAEEMVWELFTQAGPVGECCTQPWHADRLQQLQETDRAHQAQERHLTSTDASHACIAAVNVYLPKDRVTNAHQGYGFVEFRSEDDADYVSWHAYWGRGNRRCCSRTGCHRCGKHAWDTIAHVRGLLMCCTAVHVPSEQRPPEFCLPVCVVGLQTIGH